MSEENYLDRLKIEREELDVKLTKLENALKNDLVPESEIDILEAQKDIMEAYYSILTLRINKSL